MGNQLTARAPSQILSVESYLHELVEYEYESSLGSTRFFKVAKAKHKEGSVVLKVFAINDPSLLLKEYKLQVDLVRSQLLHATNCLPYQRTTIPPELSERAAFLFRQYVKDNLYDRISTRPFLIPIEKKWITFQLLCALNQCHKSKICHGDIKTENVLVSSWNWVFLADFASFKPTYMCADNPEDFNFFFDTSRRRVCNIAPERFLASSSPLSQVRQAGEMVIQGMEAGASKKTGWETGWEPLDNRDNGITAFGAMDIFSAGCVIAELFTEGTPLFDYPELLAFSVNQFDPSKVISKIEDPDIRDMVKNMTQQNPKQRHSAEEYLVQQKGKAFPEYFYSYLKLYLQRFVVPPMMAKDDVMMRLKRDLNMILEGMEVKLEKFHEENSCLVILISLITSAQRNLFHCDSKLASLDLLSAIASYVGPEVLLDRILPFMLYMVTDSFPRVRAKAVTGLTRVLSLVHCLPRGETNVFPEYVFPSITDVSQDEVVSVRVAFAESVASLAESALRFLQLANQDPSLPLTSHSDKEASPTSPGSRATSVDVVAKMISSPDAELNALHEFVQNKVVSLLTDSENIVRRSLVENGITKLCVFFGRQKANDVVLSHLITFLNDKNDWQLRSAFYNVIAGVASYVGSQAASILKPLLLQGLGDSEDSVTCYTLRALTDMTETGLVQKPLLQELIAEVVPYLCHPNIWLRQGAVGFICVSARAMSQADVHCHLLPTLKPYLTKNVIQVDQEFVLLSVLVQPVPQIIYDLIIRSFSFLKDFIDFLQDRQLVRNLTRPGQVPPYEEADDPSLLQLFQKLVNLGLTAEIEDQVLRMKDFLLRRNQHERSIHNAVQDSVSSLDGEVASPVGVINLSVGVVQRRHADLHSFKTREYVTRGAVSVPHRQMSRRSRSPMPGASSGDGSRDSSYHDESRYLSASPRVGTTRFSDYGGSTPNLSLAGDESREGTPNPRMAGRVGHESPTTVNPVQVKYPQCRHALHELVLARRDQFTYTQASRDLLEGRLKDTKTPPLGWKPKGKLVAHIHEHRLAINRIVVDSEHKKMASCSNDGTMKLFDATKLDGKSATNRSKLTYNKQGGKIKSLTFCETGTSLAACSDTGSIHVVNIDRNSLSLSKEIDIPDHGNIVDMSHFDTGPQNVLAYCTVNGQIMGWDLRQPYDAPHAWSLSNDPKLGLITSFAVDPKQSWLTVGTSSGNLVCWDMRFQLPITKINHPTDARVRRLIVHPTEPSWIISANQGNNEISFWDMETGHRQVTLWASTAPALSQTQATHHFIQGMFCAATDDYVFLLSAGSDMRVRFWDISEPKDSYIISHAANDPVNHAVVSYQTKIIEGTSVHQEMYSKQRSGAEDTPRGGSGSHLDAPSPGHHDVITDISFCQPGQSLVLTSSRDGVIKVWK